MGETKVVNELAEFAGSLTEGLSAPDPYKLVLVPEERADDAGRGPLVLPYNPEEYEGQMSPNWESRQAPGVGASEQQSDFSHSDAETQSFSLLSQPDQPGRNDEILTTLRIWAGEVSTRVGRPPLIRVQRGTGQAQKNFTGHLDSLAYTARETSRFGDIITMELRLTFRRNPKAIV